MKQWVINWILAVLSIMAILLAILKVTPFEVSEGTYIGIMISLLGLSVAILIGYQVYNAIELKSELKEQKTQNKELRSLLEKFELEKRMLEAQMAEGFAIHSSFIQYYRGQGFITCGDALLNMHEALLYSLDTNRTNYGWMFNYIRQYIAEMSSQTFVPNLAQHSDGEWYIAIPGNYQEMTLKKYIDIVFKPLFDNDSKIRKHQNYCRIQFEYERVMHILNDRITSIVKDPTSSYLSPEEKDKIINPL